MALKFLTSCQLFKFDPCVFHSLELVLLRGEAGLDNAHSLSGSGVHLLAVNLFNAFVGAKSQLVETHACCDSDEGQNQKLELVALDWDHIKNRRQRTFLANF
jgi:hypothetical protein